MLKTQTFKAEVKTLLQLICDMKKGGIIQNSRSLLLLFGGKKKERRKTEWAIRKSINTTKPISLISSRMDTNTAKPARWIWLSPVRYLSYNGLMVRTEHSMAMLDSF